MCCHNEFKVIIIKVGDYVLTNNYELLKVKEIYTDGVITVDGVKICCNDILDVKKWEEYNDKPRNIYK